MIVILSVLGTVLSGVMITIFRLFPQKTAKKALDRTIVDNQRIVNEQIEGIKDRYESQLRSLAKRNKDLERELNPVDADGQPQKESVPWEVIAAGAEQMGIPSMMLFPFKKQILQYTKGMSIEEIQQAAGSIKGLLGSKGHQQNPKEQSNGIEFA